MKRALPAIAALALLLPVAACSDDGAEADASASTSAADPTPEGFRYDAAVACTDVRNAHLPTPGSQNGTGIDAVLAAMEDQTPEPKVMTEWAEAIDAEIERVTAIRDGLAEVSSDAKREQQSWEAIVSAPDEWLDMAAERATALRSGDWEDARPLFAAGTSVQIDPAIEAVAALDLDTTDCVSPYDRAPGVEGDQVEFVTQVTEACTRINNRRHADDLDASREVYLRVLADALSDASLDEDLPDDLEDALTHARDEWQSTIDDLSEVAPTSDYADPWSRVLAAAEERRDTADKRLEAVQSGDEDAIVEAFQIRSKHVALPYDELPLGNRSCTGAAG